VAIVMFLLPEPGAGLPNIQKQHRLQSILQRISMLWPGCVEQLHVD